MPPPLETVMRRGVPSGGNAAAPVGKRRNGRGITGERIETTSGGDGTGASGMIARDVKEREVVLKGGENDLGAPGRRRVSTRCHRGHRRVVVEVEATARIREARGRERGRCGGTRSRLGENHSYLDAKPVETGRLNMAPAEALLPLKHDAIQGYVAYFRAHLSTSYLTDERLLIGCWLFMFEPPFFVTRLFISVMRITAQPSPGIPFFVSSSYGCGYSTVSLGGVLSRIPDFVPPYRVKQ